MIVVLQAWDPSIYLLWDTPFPSYPSIHKSHPPAPLSHCMRNLTLVAGQAEMERVKKEQMSGRRKQKTKK